jgi:hypothetical protein
MGYTRHHAIVVTSFDDELLKSARNKALEIYGANHDPIDGNFSKLVSEPIVGITNGFVSFFIAPDGSKEGWDTSDQSDACRSKFINWMNAQRFDDGSTVLDFVEVQFGDDNRDTRICRHSDEAF